MLAGINIAVAHPVLEGDAPLPPGRKRSAASEGGERAAMLARDRNRPVARQPVNPVLIADPQCSTKQQASKTRAIDEQIRLEAPSILDLYARDIAGLRVELAPDDHSLDMLNAELSRGLVAQEPGIEARVELHSPIEDSQFIGRIIRRRHDMIAQRQFGAKAIRSERGRIAFSSSLQPILMESNAARGCAIKHER